MDRNLRGILWFLVYLGLVSLPVCLLLVPPRPDGGGLWWDLAMGVGFSGLAIMGLQFVLTARFRRLAAPFGIDIIYYFHRWIAIGAMTLLLVHYGILRIQYPESLGSLSPFRAPFHLTAGRIALLLFVLLAMTSMFRKQLRIEYDAWRLSHGIGAAVAFGLSIWHILGVGQYTHSTLRRSLWLGYTLIWLFALVYIRLIKPARLKQRPFRLLAIKPERGDSWTLEFEPVGNHSLPFAPGQFAWLTLGSSPFRAREHPFSFAGSAQKARRLQFTIKELGDFTRKIKNFQPGDTAYIDGPHGIFTPDFHSDAAGFVLIAGGVGIAPIMSILRTFADRAERRPLLLIYGNRNWERVIFREEIETLVSALNLRVVHVIQNPPADWKGETGYITDDLLERIVNATARKHVFFVCGPAAMTKVVQTGLRRLGVPLPQIHSEHFEMA